MEPEPLDLKKQQRLLQRGIADIQHHARRAFAGGYVKDFETLENANRDFKAFVAANVTAPGIVAYTAQIPAIRHQSSEPSLLRIMFMPGFKLFSNQPTRAKGYTFDDAKTVQTHYANLEILVGLMLDD
jgi:hypothetical protein